MSRIPLFPLSRGVFPDGMLPLRIFEVRYLDLIRRCHREGEPFGVPWLVAGSEVLTPGDEPVLHPVGCMAEVVDLVEVRPALLGIRCRGGRRFRLLSQHAGAYGVWQGEVEWLAEDEPVEIPQHLQALADALGRMIASVQKAGQMDELPIWAPFRLDECGWVANRWAELLALPASTRLELLELDDPLARLDAVGRHLPGAA